MENICCYIAKPTDLFAHGMFRKKAAITACSNALSRERSGQMGQLERFMKGVGLEPVFSQCLYESNGTVFSGTLEMRAKELMRHYQDPETRFIFDVSGGDIANGILPFLNFEEIKSSDAVFWGYSDLTTIINGIYAKTGRASVLYQIRNLMDAEGEWQRNAFQGMVRNGSAELFGFSYQFLQGREMEGVVVGGNMRCLLKLAGTEFWPDMRGKILLLESAGGLSPQMASCLAQLRQLGVFGQVEGLLLGTFLSMEETNSKPEMEELVKEYAGKDIPIAKTSQIGHRANSHAIVIGRRLQLKGRT